MKEEINLLPPTARNARRSSLYHKRARSLYTSLIIAICVLGLGYGLSYGVLLWLGPTTEEVAVIDDETGITKQIRQTNTSISIVRKTLTDHQAWAPNIAAILQVIPADIAVTGIDVATIGQTIEISGTSTSRESVVLLEKELKELPWVSSVDAPLQNFASGPNVSFRFSIVRKL